MSTEAYRKRKREFARTESQKEYRREYMRVWRSKNKDKYNEWARSYHHKHKDEWKSRQRGYRLKHMYNITEEDYNLMLENQKGVCFICGCNPYPNGKNKNSKVLHIDHNHETGKVRGLLCSKCNSSLGWHEKYKTKIENYLEVSA
jgi:hypothetical protein